MPDPRNPHNPYHYKPLDQAAPIYIPPSHSTQRILPVPQESGQSDYSYGRPGEARPVYVPSSAESAAYNKGADMNNSKSKTYHAQNMLSDERSKTEIKKLEAKNSALESALSGGYQGGNMPETEYPRLPAHTNFPIPASEPAQRVMAQNAQMMPPPAPQGAPQMAPPPQPLVPTPQAPQMPRSPGFNVGGGQPDLSQLDEAYRRLGAQGG